MVFLGFCFITVSIFLIAFAGMNISLKQDIQILENRQRRLTIENISLIHQVNEYKRLAFSTYNDMNKNNISEDIVAAVKYARKKSHPDNGGNMKDFIYFNKIYKEISK